MTIQELIDKLNKEPDKTLNVAVDTEDTYGDLVKTKRVFAGCIDYDFSNGGKFERVFYIGP